MIEVPAPDPTKPTLSEFSLDRYLVANPAGAPVLMLIIEVPSIIARGYPLSWSISSILPLLWAG